MMNIRKAFLAFAAVMLLGVLMGCSNKNEVIHVDPVGIQQKVALISETVDEQDASANEDSNESAYEIEDFTFGSIVPYDFVNEEDVDRYYQAVAEAMQPNLVVVLVPSTMGAEAIKTCSKCEFVTEFGDVGVENDLAGSLAKLSGVEDDQQAFAGEAGMNFHLNFIAKHFPAAPVLPIVVGDNISSESLDALNAWMDDNLPQGTMVVGAMNWASHTVPEVAELHNSSTKTAINNFDYQEIGDLEIDNANVLQIFMLLMEKRGYMKMSFQDDFVTFFVGTREDLELESKINILAVGEIEGDNGLDFSESWLSLVENTEATIVLDELSGKNDDFFLGMHYLAFDLVDDDCYLKTKNDFSVLFCKFAEKDHDEESIEEIVNEFVDDSAEEIDLFFMYADIESHSELTDKSEDFVKFLANFGRSIVVGHGMSTIPPLTVYGDSLLFYSLGDFVTNSRLANNLRANSGGLMVNIEVREDDYKVYTFPIKISKGIPSFRTGSERKEFLVPFADEIKSQDLVELNLDRGTIEILK